MAEQYSLGNNDKKCVHVQLQTKFLTSFDLQLVKSVHARCVDLEG